MTIRLPWQTPRADETLPATVRERYPEAETAMVAHVAATLNLLLPRFPGLAMTEAAVDDLLDTPLDGLVAWQLAHSEPRDEADDVRRLSVAHLRWEATLHVAPVPIWLGGLATVLAAGLAMMVWRERISLRSGGPDGGHESGILKAIVPHVSRVAAPMRPLVPAAPRG